MLNRNLFAIVVTLSFLLAACAPAAAPTAKPTAPPKAASPAAQATPAAKPPSPALSPTPKVGAEEPRSGGILTSTHFTDPPSFDPIQEGSVSALVLVLPSYSTVVQHDPFEPAKVVGDLAEKWEMSPDGKSYTFNLVKNVKWHDGKPLTSEDARFSLELIRKPPQGIISPRKEWLKAVDKIETTGNDALKITLQYPSPSFIHNLGDGRIVVVPKSVVEAKGNIEEGRGGHRPLQVQVLRCRRQLQRGEEPGLLRQGPPLR
ncbi:MAG: hypothetical protein HYX92_10405 [Chloroflexi bacterium]|nr:hypothetical protein [Chloroflexota bacterium]